VSIPGASNVWKIFNWSFEGATKTTYSSARQLLAVNKRTFGWKVIIQYLSSSSDDERLCDLGELWSAIPMTRVIPLGIVLGPLSRLSLKLLVLDPSRLVSRIVD